MAKANIYLTVDPELRAYFIKQREALLKQVDALEEFLGVPKTADMRRYAKENGFYEKQIDVPT